MGELSYKDKFCSVLGSTFDNIGIIMDNLNKSGKTNLTSGMVDVLKNYLLSQDKDYTVKSFIENSYKYWDNIKNKDEKTMLMNSEAILGEHANNPEFASVKLIFTSEIDSEAKESIWRCIHALVTLSVKYVYTERGMNVIRADNKLRISYTKNKSFMEEVDVIKCNKDWNIKLF